MRRLWNGKILTVSGLACIAAAMMAMCGGCYKELPPQPQAAATPAPAPAPSANPKDQGVKPDQNNMVGQPASSALGAAKRSAENTVKQAEQQSQHTADENPNQ